MIQEANEINWDEIMSKFTSYEGSLIEFCRANNIKAHQLYYRRKRLEIENKPTFHAITIKEKEVNSVVLNTPVNTSNDIRITIGKANIYIPNSEKDLLPNIIKELAKTC